jgi:hypothetical protein
MRKVLTLAMATLLIGFVVVGMFAYVETTNLEKWGTFSPLVELSPMLAAAVGVGGIVVYAFVRRGRG